MGSRILSKLGAGAVALAASAGIALALASPPATLQLPPPTATPARVGTVQPVAARPPATWTPPPTPAGRTGPAAAYPDPGFTPGAALPVSALEVCTPGYAQRARAVSESVKSQVFARYGIAQDGALYEVDHFIPLELGGANSIDNLWPQRWEGPGGAREKDVAENALHTAVCAGRLSLDEARTIMAADWYAYYLTLRRGA